MLALESDVFLESWLGRSTKKGDDPGRSMVDQGVPGLAGSSSGILGKVRGGALLELELEEVGRGGLGSLKD